MRKRHRTQPCNYLDKSASFSNLDGMPNEILQSHTTDQPMAPGGRDIEHKQPCNYLDKSASFSNLDGMPNEILQSHTTDQPMVPWGRDIEHKQLCKYLDKSASFSNFDGMPNDMLQSHTADKPLAPWERDVEHRQPQQKKVKQPALSSSRLDTKKNSIKQGPNTHTRNPMGATTDNR